MRENNLKILNRFDLKGSNSKKNFRDWNKILNSKYLGFDLDVQNHIFRAGTLKVLDISDIELGLIHCDRFLIRKRFEHKSKSIEVFVCLIDHAKMPLVQIIVNHLKNIFTQADFLNFEQLKMLSFQILDLLAKILFSQNKNFSQKKETTVRLTHFKRILNTIDENLKSENFNTKKLADKIGLSKRYIQKISAIRNITVSKIIRKRRIEIARRWLPDPSRDSLSISKIGLSMMFSDAAHFSRIFRKYNVFYPKKYRKKLRF